MAKINKYFVVAVFLIAVAATFVVYIGNFNRPPIRSDGLGYYVYLPSLFIYRDPGLTELISEYEHGLTPDSWNGVTVYPETGKYLNKYPIGVAIMQLPFFFVAQVMALIFQSGNLEGGFSFFHHGLIGLAGIVYFALGVWILQKLLSKFFRREIVLLTLSIVIFGTNIFSYATYDSTFSHVYSFALINLWLLSTVTWHARASSTRRRSWAALAALSAGMILIVRPANFPILLFWPLYGIAKDGLVPWFKLQIKNWRYLAMMALIVFVVLLPQLLYWHEITGHWFIFSYGNNGEYFNWGRPEIANVLFSVRKGLFFWSPLLLLGIPGLLFIYKKHRTWFFPILIISALQTYVIASWWFWPYGGSFGHRAFVDMFGLWSVAIAACFGFILSHKWLTRTILILVTLLVIVNLIQMWQYWLQIIPFDGTTWQKYVQIFLKVTK